MVTGNKKMPKISVLLPVYNTKEAYLRACIESILQQSYGDFELIIINDASTDEHVETVIRSYDDARNGIQTLIHYPTPPHQQPAYQEWNSKHYPISEEIHKTIISLPISPVMTDEEVQQIVETVNAYH